MGISLLEEILKIEVDPYKQKLCIDNIQLFQQRIDALHLSQGEKHLRAAIALDESRQAEREPGRAKILSCKEAYLAAVECYMSIKCRDQALLRRISSLLDRIESLSRKLAEIPADCAGNIDSSSPLDLSEGAKRSTRALVGAPGGQSSGNVGKELPAGINTVDSTQ